MTNLSVVEAGFALGVFDDATLDVAAEVLYAPSGVMNQRLWGESFAVVPAGSAQQDREVQRLADGLVAQEGAVAGTFLDIVEEADRQRFGQPGHDDA